MDNAEFDPAYSHKSKYKLWLSDEVRFSDLDALGHVSSVRINEFFATARTSLFRQAIPNWPAAKHVPVLKINAINHHAEIGFPQKLEIGLCVENFGNTSVTLVMGLFDDKKCFALCRNIFVFIHVSTRKPLPPAPSIKRNFLDHGAFPDRFSG